MIKKCLKILSTIAFVVGFLVLLSYNIQHNDSFWYTSFANCVTIGVAIIVSYVFVQRRSDIRKQKDIIVELIFKLQAAFSQPNIYNLENMSIEEITMRNRDLNNRLHILETFAKKFSVAEDVKFITEKYKEYEDLIGNHIGDPDYLKSSQKELQRPIGLIDNKLTEIAIKLFE